MISPPNIKGLQFIPINKNKVPMVTEWQSTKKQHDFSKAYGVGLVCGEISGNVEVLDIDLKYDLTGTLYDRFKSELYKADSSILKLMTVQKTRSGGYHFIWRCSELSGNKKLANRYTTPEERAATYSRTLEAELPKKVTLEEAKPTAERAAANDKVRVLLETRGEKGYIAVAPTIGYEFVYGSLENIKQITPEQRNTILAVAASFNEVFAEYVPPKPKQQVQGLTPLTDYDNRGDVVSLLISHGWTYVGDKGAKVLLRRPGDTSAAYSGNFDRDKNWFTVFSSSTEFETEKAYLPHAVLAKLEYDGDFNATAKALYDQGYGDRITKKEEPRKPEPVKDELDFLAKEDDYKAYHTALRDGTFQEYPGFGIATLDKYLRLKDGDLYMFNGIDNVGKSTVVWYLQIMASLILDWRWIVFTAENSVGGFMRKMIEFYHCKPIAEQNEIEYMKAEKWVKEHFTIIKANEALYSLRDLMKMSQSIIDKLGPHKGLLVDPYNALKLDLKQGSKNSTHEEHYELFTEFKIWGKNRGITLFVNAHVITEATRRVDGDGYQVAPNKADTEGGGKFANKADQFVTIHRVTQHPTEWMISDLHVRKTKETESGGRNTPFDEPVRLAMIPNSCGFLEYDDIGRYRNPVLDIKNAKNPVFRQLNEPQRLISIPDEPEVKEKPRPITSPSLFENDDDENDVPF